MIEYAIIYTILALLLGLIMTWGVGANDLANIMSTTMGSKALSVKQALCIAVIFEFAGAVLGGAHVTSTIRHGIINTALLKHDPEILIQGFLATLLASTTWILLASVLGMPVSITNAIVGAMVGFGSIVLGVDAVQWHTISKIAISWICSPAIACMAAYILFMIIRRSIFNTDTPARNARLFLPLYFFIVGLVFSNMTILKGLTHYHITMLEWKRVALCIGCSLLITILGFIASCYVPKTDETKRFTQFAYVEKLFSLLMGLTACAMVFAHGSNDVAIAMGPVSAILSIIIHHGQMTGHAPSWIIWFGCFGVVLGLVMYGHKIIATVGSEITSLTPSRAFAATLAAATTVIVSTSTGIPVSATQTLVGGVMGVGLARGISALNLSIVRNIFMSWFITIPAAAVLNIVFYYTFHLIFGG